MVFCRNNKARIETKLNTNISRHRIINDKLIVHIKTRNLYQGNKNPVYIHKANYKQFLFIIYERKTYSATFAQNAIPFQVAYCPDTQIQHLNDFNIGLINGWWSFDGLYSVWWGSAVSKLHKQNNGKWLLRTIMSQTERR